MRALGRSLFSVLILFAAAHAGVTIVAPAAGVSASSPVHVIASATPASSTHPITLMRIYVDGVRLYSAAVNSIDAKLTIANGNHQFTIQAWDNAGTLYRSSMTLTVAAAPTVPSTAKVFNKIEEMTGWQSCDVCAGAGGQGPNTPHWMAQNQTTPSLDGNSAELHIDPPVSYADALWWKQLGSVDTATHFVYDISFYLANPSAPQALEFDVNQSLLGYKYIFGSECGFTGAKQWKIWDYTLRWQSTGISCTPVMIKGWHKLRWEFERTAGRHTRFVAITVDGVRTTINRYYTPKPSSVRELNVAVQIDGNKNMVAYSLWIDAVKLSVW